MILFRLFSNYRPDVKFAGLLFTTVFCIQHVIHERVVTCTPIHVYFASSHVWFLVRYHVKKTCGLSRISFDCGVQLRAVCKKHAVYHVFYLSTLTLIRTQVHFLTLQLNQKNCPFKLLALTVYLS